MNKSKDVSELMNRCSDESGLACALFRARHAMNLYFESRCDEQGLSVAEGKVLGVLGATGQLSPGNLAELLGIKPSTVTSVLDRLVARGLIQRSRRPENRRSVIVSLTDEGREVAKWAKDVIAEFERKVDYQTTASDIEGFRAVVESIIKVTETFQSRNQSASKYGGANNGSAVHSLNEVNAMPESE